ncbi:TetR/AcrR family transcriptional regulator [Nocardia sp. NPDC050406]|uniref:TetR/AcrR family transcriptional regulator n=1 Tax=Nocardia sp. NPDC050406 TaxID=3364318 RepID=UPI0037A17C40
MAKEDGRKARARATKAKIVRAATELFVADGYSATSITAIATRAGVGEQTVYYALGNKRAILSAALDQAVAGDDEPVPTLERSWTADALADPDPLGQLRAQVRGAAEILERAAPLLDVVRGAAATDAELAELWATNIAQRATVQHTFAAALATKTPLRGSLSIDEAADIMQLLLGPESYSLLVGARGWSQRRWRDWTLEALVRQLTDLTPEPSGQ